MNTLYKHTQIDSWIDTHVWIEGVRKKNIYTIQNYIAYFGVNFCTKLDFPLPPGNLNKHTKQYETSAPWSDRRHTNLRTVGHAHQ